MGASNAPAAPAAPADTCVQCGECENCSHLMQCSICKNCEHMFQCSMCTDCSFLVRSSGQQGVHGDPRTYHVSVCGMDNFWDPNNGSLASGEPSYEAAKERMERTAPWTRGAVQATGPAKVAVLACGSRGDVQPPVALCLGLQKAGFGVMLLVRREEEAFVRSFGLQVRSGCRFELDPAQIALEDGNRQHEAYEEVRAFAPHLILYSKTSCALAWLMEEHLGVPGLEYSLQSDTTEDCPSVWKGHLAAERLHFDTGLGMRSMQGWSKADVQERCGGRRPVLLALSPLLSYKTWPAAQGCTNGFHATGPWVLEPQEQQALLTQNAFLGSAQHAELEAFLDEGPKPIYISWGSMVIDGSAMACLAVRCLRDLGRRGIILGGAANLGRPLLQGAPDAAELQAYADTNVLWLQWAPHEVLLPRCSLAVHHGGAGTLAAVQRAGLPSVVTPVAFDQFKWAELVKEKGLGQSTTPLFLLQAPELVDAVRRSEAHAILERARLLGERLRNEDGVGRAVGLITEYLQATQGCSPQARDD